MVYSRSIVSQGINDFATLQQLTSDKRSDTVRLANIDIIQRLKIQNLRDTTVGSNGTTKQEARRADSLMVVRMYNIAVMVTVCCRNKNPAPRII